MPYDFTNDFSLNVFLVQKLSFYRTGPLQITNYKLIKPPSPIFIILPQLRSYSAILLHLCQGMRLPHNEPKALHRVLHSGQVLRLP